MVRRFDENLTLYYRALQIWQILVSKASNRQSMTYGNLSDMVGGSVIPIDMGRHLNPIMRYCQINGLPPLTILVVNQGTGEPGQGLSSINALNMDREKVFNYGWFGIVPPTLEEFERADRGT